MMIKPCHSTERELRASPALSPIILVDSNAIKLRNYSLAVVVWLRKENISEEEYIRRNKLTYCYKMLESVVLTEKKILINTTSVILV